MVRIQILQLEMLKVLEFNNIRGEKIVADLIAHQELWRGVMIDFKWKIEKNITARDAWKFWNLYILPKPGREDDLLHLAKTWNPNDIHFNGDVDHWKDAGDEPFITSDEESEQNPKLYLELFWQGAPPRTPGGSKY